MRGFEGDVGERKARAKRIVDEAAGVGGDHTRYQSQPGARGGLTGGGERKLRRVLEIGGGSLEG